MDLSPHNVGRILDDAIADYRANFKTLALASVSFVLPFALFQTVAQTFYYRATADLYLQVFSSDPGASYDPAMYIAYALLMLGMLVYGIASLYFGACVYRCGEQMLYGRMPPVRDLLKSGGRVFWQMLVIGILSGIAGYIAYYATFGFGMVLVQALFVAAAPAVAFEGADAIGGIKRSFSLVSGGFWRVVLFLLGVGLVTSQMSSALLTPIAIRDIVLSVQAGHILPKLPIYWKVIDGVIQGLALSLVLPISYLASMRCYLDLRSRTEGMDLMMRARELVASA
jgi:hypothetical protein